MAAECYTEVNKGCSLGLILNSVLWKQAEEGHGVFGVQEKMKGSRGQAECSRRLYTAEAYGDPQSMKKKQAKGKERDRESQRRERAIPGRVNFMGAAVACWFPVHTVF
ncbi:uncharacterized [Tachysurus ichikawai]